MRLGGYQYPSVNIKRQTNQDGRHAMRSSTGLKEDFSLFRHIEFAQIASRLLNGRVWQQGLHAEAKCNLSTRCCTCQSALQNRLPRACVVASPQLHPPTPLWLSRPVAQDLSISGTAQPAPARPFFSLIGQMMILDRQMENSMATSATWSACCVPSALRSFIALDNQTSGVPIRSTQAARVATGAHAVCYEI